MYISYTPNDKHSFNINYGRRISRPHYSNLNPFRWVASPYSYYVGNPLLKPAFTHNLELQYAYKENSITTFFFSHSTGNFEDLDEVDEKTKIVKSSPQNFINHQNFGVIQRLMFKPFSFWDTRLEFSAFYDMSKSTNSVSLKSLNGWNFDVDWSNDFALNKKKTLLFNISYVLIPRGVSHLDYDLGTQRLDMSLKAMLLKKKLVINLYANDILRTNKKTYVGYSNGIEKKYSNYFDQRFFRLSVSYNFGKAFNNREHQSKNQDEINRAN